jgi:hypothetical protein
MARNNGASRTEIDAIIDEYLAKSLSSEKIDQIRILRSRLANAAAISQQSSSGRIHKRQCK